MTDILKPVYGQVWATTGEKLSPDSTKVDRGWVQEMMPYQWENFLQNRQDVAITYILQKGIPEWSSDQEYIENKSVVSYGGQLYMATSTVTNVLPTVAASWKKMTVSFDSNGTIPIALGGTGAVTAADARTNLGIGTIALQAANAVSISGGVINSTPIGATTPSTGKFTNIEATGTLTASSIIGPVTGNASSATKLATPRTVSISGAVTGTPTNFDGSANIEIPITTLNVGAATVGVLAVNRGGTGVTTSTGTGANVQAVSPTLTGTPTAPTAAITINTTQLATTAFVQAVNTADTGSSATSVALKTARNFSITGGAIAEVKPFNGTADVVLDVTDLDMSKATAGTLAVAQGGTGVTTSTGSGATVRATSPTLDGTPTVPTAATDTNSLQIANMAAVQAVNSSDTGSAATALKLKTARTIGGVSFDGSANINLPGVNTTGDQSTTGSAATLTTARTINGTSFNGSANITTDNWGTARNITIGSTAKSVNGSANVSWTVAEIGAEPTLAAGTTSQYYCGNKTWQTLNKAAVGLSNVDNTADSAKPVSTAQQTALNLKANLASPAFTGNPTAPTQSAGSNTTHLATTAFVTTAVGNAVANLTNHTGGQSIAPVAGLPLGLPLLVKVDPSLPCLVKTSATTLAVKASTHVKIGNGYISFTAQTTVSMPTLTPGEDYAVFVHPDGTASALADPFFAPAAAPVPGALKIGGFHYGLTAPGTTPASGGFATTGFTNSGGNYVWTQARVDRVAGINEFSIWDLTHRSKGEQHGFTFDPQRKVWDAIYFCSPDHITNGISRYNTPVASGTVPPKIPLGEYGGNGVMTYGRLSAYEALEILASHGCKLMTQEEFASGALGVTEGQSLGGAASTIPATKREPGYTSRIGLEQATGHICTIGGPLTSEGGSAWTAGPNRGNFCGGAGLPLFGGNRVDAATSGSRTSSWNHVFWASGSHIGLRAACDHLSA